MISDWQSRCSRRSSESREGPDTTEMVLVERLQKCAADVFRVRKTTENSRERETCARKPGQEDFLFVLCHLTRCLCNVGWPLPHRRTLAGRPGGQRLISSHLISKNSSKTTALGVSQLLVRSISSAQSSRSSASIDEHLQQRSSQTGSGQPSFCTPSLTGSHYQMALVNSHCRSLAQGWFDTLGAQKPSQTCWQ